MTCGSSRQVARAAWWRRGRMASRKTSGDGRKWYGDGVLQGWKVGLLWSISFLVVRQSAYRDCQTKRREYSTQIKGELWFVGFNTAPPVDVGWQATVTSRGVGQSCTSFTTSNIGVSKSGSPMQPQGMSLLSFAREFQG